MSTSSTRDERRYSATTSGEAVGYTVTVTAPVPGEGTEEVKDLVKEFVDKLVERGWAASVYEGRRTVTVVAYRP